MNTQKQIDRFKDAAQELECDESEKRFDRKLKKIAKPKKETGAGDGDRTSKA